MSIRGSDASRPPSRSRPNMPAVQRTSSTPYSSNSSHTVFDRDVLSSQSGKTKRDSPALALEELLKPLITVKPQFPLGLTSEKRSVLKPLMLLARECLPLSSLDLSAPNGEFPVGPGRFFESHIRILDLEGRLRQVPSVLIARSDNTRNVYAVERHQNGLYVVCKLGAWVSIEKLGHLAEACYAPRCYPAQTSEATETIAATITPQLHKENKRKRAAIEELQSMVRKRARTASIAQFEPQTGQSEAPIPPQTVEERVSPTVHVELPTPHGSPARSNPSGPRSGPLDPSADSQTSADDIFQFLRSQYIEALYHSKGSLAYFAKGPLSRARTTFHFECDANLDINDLLDFLKSLVVAIPQIDKKYKETVPKLVEEMKMLVVASDDEEGSKPKRRQSKKMKFGKDGLWTSEVEHVKKWWRINQPRVPEDGDSLINPQEVKYHISCLRTRETHLQMIILLEILALEAIRPTEDVQDSQLPGMPVERLPKEKSVGPTPKKKDKHDFSLLLNLHVDRMSIWQSTTLDEMEMIAAEAQAKSGQHLHKSGRANSDPLKDFCIDIIVPFFAGRLPELCADLNKKLGGPVAASPPKSKKPVAPVAANAFVKPGSATKRPGAARASAPKSLEKLFESDQQKRKASRRMVDPLARMRSATPAAIPGLKREGSEPLGFDRIQHEDKSLGERSRNILSRSVSTSGTEDPKAQKKAKVEAELKEAISALKKPNRQMVSQSIAEEAAKRTGSSGSPHPRKQKKPVRNPAAASNVQVKATPANFRFRDALSADTRVFSNFNPAPRRTELDTIPSSSSVIPATAPRDGFRDHLRDGLAAFHIASTPDKVVVTSASARASTTQFSKPTANDDYTLPSSPIMLRRTATGFRDQLTVPSGVGIEPSSPVLPKIFETPVKQRLHLPSTFTDQNISSTPPEPRSKAVFFETRAKNAQTSAPACAAASTTLGEAKPHNNTTTGQPAPTLYQQMGWDDDYGNLIS